MTIRESLNWKSVIAVVCLVGVLAGYGFIVARQRALRKMVPQITAEGCFVMGDLYAVHFGIITPVARQAPLLQMMSELGEPHSLRFSGCEPTDEALRQICLNTRFRSLSIHNSRFGDRQMELLESCKQMQSLSLGHCDVSDASISTVAGLKGLVECGIGHTNITPAGIARLKKLRPNLKISFTPREELSGGK